MRTWTIANGGGRYRIPGGSRALVVLLAVTLYGLAGTRLAAAQSDESPNLDSAVASLAKDLELQLSRKDRLANWRVFVSPLEFHEERTLRNLPLSVALYDGFITALGNRDVNIELSEDDVEGVMVLQGTWRMSSAGQRLSLSVKVRERIDNSHRVVATGKIVVQNVDERLLEPDLDAWGRYVVKKLENRVTGRGRRAVHVNVIFARGDEAEIGQSQENIKAFWLEPAFTRSRRFRLLATPAGERQSDGALHVRVIADSETVKASLKFQDNDDSLSVATVEMARALFAGILPSKIEKLIGRCAERIEEGDLSRAWVCYGEVLKRDGGSEEALQGRQRIEAGYRERMQEALKEWDFAGAKEVVKQFGNLAPGASRVRERVREWTEEIEDARVFRDCDGCPQLVVIPAGSYTMGSPASEVERSDDEGPLHRVAIAEPLAVGIYEVTVGEWRRFVEATGYSTGDECRAPNEAGEWVLRPGIGWRNAGFEQTERHPVVCVNWDDVRAYVEWLSMKTGRGYRLLSESEWEFAARGRTKTARFWGEGKSGQCRHANGGDRTLKERLLYPA